MDSNKIYRNDFIYLYYHHLSQIQIISAIFFLPMISCNELSITLSTRGYTKEDIGIEQLYEV